VFLGVCRGLAEYFDFSLFWLRMIFVILLFLSGLWPVVGIYLLASFLLKPEPVHPIGSQDEQDFYDGYVNSRKRTVRQLLRRYQSLERRLQRMEDAVTAREFEWEHKFNG
jgi:phage shock protein C